MVKGLPEALQRLNPTTEWLRFNAAVHRPMVELAERVGQFEGPFSYLADVHYGFDPGTRFLLNRVREGDEKATAARHETELFWRKVLLNEDPPMGYVLQYLDRQFYGEHEDEIREFTLRHYPWERARFESIPGRPLQEFGDVLDEIILPRMGEFGFKKQFRRRSSRTWRCKTRALAHEVQIGFDVGPHSTVLTAHLGAPDLRYGKSLGDPFFFSGTSFPIHEGADIRTPLTLFFDEYRKTFPHVLTALQKSMAEAAPWLELAVSRMGPS